MRIDCHVHMVGNGSDNSGCRLLLRSSYRKLLSHIMMHELGLPACLLKEKLEEGYLTRLIEWTRASSITHLVLLAQDWVRDDKGNAIESESALFVPNEVVLNASKKYPEILPAASIHPARPDAIDELMKCSESGAVMMKCLPIYHRIDPREPRFKKFWRTMADLKMLLLAHTGGELSLPANDARLADPKILIPVLEEGVTVIAAHGGSSSHYFDKNYMQDVREMLPRFPNLYVDNSGMNTPIRSRHFRTLLDTGFSGRIIHGSDLPIPISALWVRLRGLISREAYQAAVAQKNMLERDVIIKRAMGFAEDTFTLLGTLLQPERSTRTKAF